MLTTLRITDIVLIEHAEVLFQSGFNVLTGETGAGKSAILRALALVLGQRADAQALRQGAEKGIVEAAFETPYPAALRRLLDDAGVSFAEDEPLILRRELTAAGKSRAFVNHQLAQVSLLRAVGALLVEIVGQHSNQELREVDAHRQILDAFGQLQDDVKAFQQSWEQEKGLKEELERLIHGEAQRLRQLEEYERQLDELDEARLQTNEEENLFTEYTKLTHADELLSYANSVYEVLTGENGAVLSALNRQQNVLVKLAGLDSSLQEAQELYQNAVIELQEVAHTLRHYAGSVERDPARADYLNERLALIARLKKKYGPTLEEVFVYHEKLKNELQALNNADERIEHLRELLAKAEEATHHAAQTLSDKRQKVAGTLAEAWAQQLRQLNMPKADLRIHVEKGIRHSQGDDRVEIFMAPNVGEKLIAVRECASGGELSRLILALKALMAGKEKTPTLVFDEVDANIGGETATVVGEQLAAIGQRHQLLSITHFPQVARHAHHHLQIRKEEKKGRTHTHVQVLEGTERTAELRRMAGG